MARMSEKEVQPSIGVKTTAKSASAPPVMFERASKRLRRARAAKRCAKSGRPAFFTQRCAEDAAERLQDITRTFERALIIGPPGTWAAIAKQLPANKHPKSVTCVYDGPTEAGGIDVADDALSFGVGPFEVNSYDLIISMLSLHSVNDLPGGLMHMAHILEPDGLMMASLFGGETLSNLRQSLYAVETKLSGHISPRIFPMIDFSQAASLLGRAGFALPVVDTDRFTVNYGALQTLVDDLRDQGETNILAAREPSYLGRNFLPALSKHHRETVPHPDGKHKIGFEILWLSGWKPHERQQKPLKPGSAKMRLADALDASETKI